MGANSGNSKYTVNTCSQKREHCDIREQEVANTMQTRALSNREDVASGNRRRSAVNRQETGVAKQR